MSEQKVAFMIQNKIYLLLTLITNFSGNHFNSSEGLIMTSVKNLKKLKKNAGLKLKCKEKNNLGIGLSNN